jgi:hypothetical protein
VAFRDWNFARNFEADMNSYLEPFETSKNTDSPKSSFWKRLLWRGRKAAEEDTAELESLTLNSSGADDTRSAAAPGDTLDEGQVRSKNPTRDHHWTRVHSHFALMGGFVFDVDKLEPFTRLRIDKGRKVLHPAGLRMLAQNAPDLIPDISREFIIDKSKADVFAKVIACLQAISFTAIVVGRLATNHRISLLELNVSLHAICCLLLYVAWWHKPLDIVQPFVLDVSDERTTRFFLWLLSMGHALKCDVMGPDGEIKEGVVLWNFYFQKRHQIVEMRPDGTNTLENSTTLESSRVQAVQVMGQGEPTEAVMTKLDMWQTIYGFQFNLVRPKHARDWTRWTAMKEAAHVYLSDRDLKWMKSIFQQRPLDVPPFQAYGSNNIPPEDRRMFTKNTWLPVKSDRALKSSRSSPFDVGSSSKVLRYLTGLDLSTSDIIFTAGICAAAALYGCIHLLAWNGPFATMREQWMWRIACLIIATPVIAGLILIVIEQSERILRTVLTYIKANSYVTRRLNDYLIYHPAVILFATYSLVYVAARAYVIVECFINLARLPPEVYKEPAWSRYVPLFGRA